jgi:hypothetical protein
VQQYILKYMHKRGWDGREPYYIFFKKMQKIINIFKQNGEATRKSLRLILKLVATSQIAHIGVN